MRRIERALLLIGVVSLAWVGAVYLFAKFDDIRQSRELDELRTRRASVAPVDVNLPAPATPPVTRAPRARPASGALIGRVEVPRLGVSAIVREGVDTSTLRRAVGHVPETALPGETGNAALAAHRDTFFRALRHVRSGDRIQVTTPDGVHEYRVARTRVVNPEDVSVLDPTKEPTLTLITCYPFNYIGSAPKRFIVTATAPAPANTLALAPPAGGTMPRLPGRLITVAANVPTAPTEARQIARAATAPVGTSGVNTAPDKRRRLSKDSGRNAQRADRRIASRSHKPAVRTAAAPRSQSTDALDHAHSTRAARSGQAKKGVWGKLLQVFKPKPPRDARPRKARP